MSGKTGSSETVGVGRGQQDRKNGMKERQREVRLPYAGIVVLVAHPTVAKVRCWIVLLQKASFAARKPSHPINSA